MARKRLGEILVQAGVLDEARLRAALAEQRRWGGPLGRILIDMGGISEEAMVQALSQQLNFPTVNLDNRQIAMDVLDLVPAELAEQHSVVPFGVQGKFLDVAMADPTNLGIVDELRIRTRLNVRPYLSGPKMIERAVAKYYGRGVATITFGPGAGQVLEPPTGQPANPAQMPLNSRVLDDQQIGSASPPVVRQTGPLDPSVANALGLAPAVPVSAPRTTVPPPSSEREREIAALQARVQHLEALVARDEDVLRKLLGLLIEKGLASREEILERISS